MTELIWNMDNLDAIGGHQPTVLGSPRVIDTPGGRALEFDGTGDALVLDTHPLEGAEQFTLEVIFRPDAGGLEEQRFFHLQETDSEDRMLLETRLTGDGHWFLDTYIQSGATEQTHYADDCLHPVGQWHQAALVFDGHTMSHYVNAALERSAEIAFTPARAGKTSIGSRINRVCWFKGALRTVRLAHRALTPEEFLQP